jgi:NADPH:quinone reductase-like Zn-dependent oxidoreductase
MSSLSFSSFGDPVKVLKAGETVAVDQPARGQVKVSLKTSPVTFEDIRIIRGLSAHRSQAGVAGTYGVGTVSSAGPGVSGLSPSSLVLVTSGQTWNSEALVDSQDAFIIEADYSVFKGQLACLPDAASAWALLHNFTTLKSGDYVIRTDEKTALTSAIDQIAKCLGVHMVVATNSDLVDSKFKEKMKSKGSVKLAITSQTGSNARALHSLTNDGGVLVTYNGPIPAMNTSLSGIEVPSLALIFSDKQVCGFDFLAWAKNRPTEASRAISECVKLMESGQLKFSPVTFGVNKVNEAVKSAEGGQSAVIEL